MSFLKTILVNSSIIIQSRCTVLTLNESDWNSRFPWTKWCMTLDADWNKMNQESWTPQKLFSVFEGLYSLMRLYVWTQVKVISSKNHEINVVRRTLLPLSKLILTSLSSTLKSICNRFNLRELIFFYFHLSQVRKQRQSKQLYVFIAS